MPKLYASAIMAFKFVSGEALNMASNIYVCFAETDAEAEGAAYLAAIERWPKSDGWCNHDFNAAEIPAELIHRAADMLRGAH